MVSGKSLTSTCSGLTMVAGITTILWDLGQFYGTWASFRDMGLGPISFMGLGQATHWLVLPIFYLLLLHKPRIALPGARSHFAHFHFNLKTFGTERLKKS